MTWRVSGALDTSERTIAILLDRRWPQTAKEVAKISSSFDIRSVLKKRTERPKVLEVSLLGVGTVRHLERNAW